MEKEYKIWKRKDRGGIYYIGFSEYPGQWFSSKTKIRDEAIAWAERNKLRNLDNRNKKLLFKHFAEGFFDPEDPHGWLKRMERKNKKYAPNWYKRNQGNLNNYILPKFGRQLLSTINTRQIDNWYIDIICTSGKPAADNTKNKILQTLNIILQEAMDQGYIEQNPIDSIERISDINKPRETFTKEEIIKLFPLNTEECIKIWGSLSWYLYFRIMAVCGLRPSEVSALHWDDYYPDMNGFVFRHSLDSERNLKGLKTEKTGKKVKIGYIDDKTAKELNRLKIESNALEDSIIFPGRIAPVISPESALKHLRWKASKVIELGKRTSYSFRHTFDTEMLRHLDRDTVNDLMGHTAYRKEYDHRTGEEILEQRKDVRDIINGKF